jgi:LacI family transcriptional regulator
MITIKSIAGHFNISAAAVSKALNGLPGVSDELRKEIARYAKDNHYIPNIYGRGLKGEALGVIGVILSDNTNMIHSKLIKGIELEADKHAHNIILCNSNEDWQKEKQQINILLQKRIGGLLIVPSPPGSDEPKNRYQILTQVGIPYVSVYRTLEGCKCDVVKGDNVFGGSLATQYLLQKGHTKVLHITTDKNISSCKERIEGYRLALEQAGLPFSAENVVFVDESNREKIKSTVVDIIKRRDDFTAIFTFNDIIAFAVMLAIRSLGKRIPEDIALIGFDNNDMADISIVPLTTVPQDNIAIGQVAVDILFGRMGGNKEPFKQLLIRPEKVIERESV